MSKASESATVQIGKIAYYLFTHIYSGGSHLVEVFLKKSVTLLEYFSPQNVQNRCSVRHFIKGLEL